MWLWFAVGHVVGLQFPHQLLSEEANALGLRHHQPQIPQEVFGGAGLPGTG